MKYIITDFFEKELSRIPGDLKIEEIISKTQHESKNFIILKEPFFKIKVRSRNKTYRVLCVFDSKENIILFIHVFDKKDKKYGNNLHWNLHKKDILNWQFMNSKCIEEGKYHNIFK